MKKMTQLLAAGAAMALAINANAATISFDDTFTDVEGNGGGLLHLTQFDATMGTLQSVKIELIDKLTGFIQVENLGLAPDTFTGSMTGTLTSPFASINLSAYASHVFNLAAVNQSGSSATYDIGLVTDSFSHTYTGNPELALFTGTGNVELEVNGEVTPLFNGSGNAIFYSEGTIDAYAKVTYTYATLPVPEPETYAMLLAGLGLMGAVLRKRKAA